MRLAQLARKIGIKPSEIADFLADKNLPIEDSSNAKVSEEQLEEVLMYYAPGLLSPVADEEPQELMPEEKTKPILITEDIEPSEESLQVSNDLNEDINSDENTSQKEVIKPVLVELPGLRVVGKIDLPEPKKKVEGLEDKGEEAKEESSVKENNERPRRRNNVSRENERRPRKNIVALQREREAREALQRKQQERELDKELRTKRYLNKVKQPTPIPQRVKKSKFEDEYEVYTEPEKSKSFFGKILNWFVSE